MLLTDVLRALFYIIFLEKTFYEEKKTDFLTIFTFPIKLLSKFLKNYLLTNILMAFVN